MHSKRETSPVAYNLLLAESDEYLFERVRLAFEAETACAIHTGSLGELVSLVHALHEPAVLLIPITQIFRSHDRIFPAPVLGIGPPALFDSVPDCVCDDLIAQSFGGAELRYRIHRVLAPVYTFAGGRVLTCTPFRLGSGSTTIELTPSQYHQISALLRARGATVPREALAALAGTGTDGTTRAVDMSIARLRKKLRLLTCDWPNPPIIVSHRGNGYALAE